MAKLLILIMNSNKNERVINSNKIDNQTPILQNLQHLYWFLKKHLQIGFC